jgi:hypothetical protein
LKRSPGQQRGPGIAQLPARGGVCLEPILREACSRAYPVSAICVQRFDDSLSSAIRITYRISLRSSSLREPRYPLLRVVLRFRKSSGARPQRCCGGGPRTAEHEVFSVWGFEEMRYFGEGGGCENTRRFTHTHTHTHQPPSTHECVLRGARVGGGRGTRDPSGWKGQASVTGGRLKVHRGLIRGYVLMILPQVHLRKPCYDFYFL